MTNKHLFESDEVRQIKRDAEFFRALNASAASIQQAVHSETAVFEAFSTQFSRLGLHGSINLLVSDTEMEVRAVALPKTLIRIADRLESFVNLSLVGYRYPLDESGTDAKVINTGSAIFLEDNSQKILEVMPRAPEWAMRLMVKTFAGMPAVLAPITAKEGKMQGVLYVAGSDLRKTDLPAIAAFSNHISIALQNAYLLADMEEARASLQQQMRMFNTMLATTPDNFTVYDAEHRFVYLSPGILKRFNLTLEEAVGKTWRELDLPAVLGEPGDQALNQVLATGESLTDEIQYEIDGERRALEFTLSPLGDDDGNITRIVATSRDVTERNRAQEAMHHAQKLESLGVLAGGVAHDFNNLLVALMGQTSIAMAKLPADEPARKHVEKAMKAAERASHLTRQLLAYSGRGQLESRQLSLNQLIEDNFHLLQVAVPKQVKLNLSLWPSLPPVEGDPGQLQQIVMNLILNAAEAIGEEPGSIMLSTELRTVTAKDVELWQLTNYPLEPGPYALLKVEDDGPGMDEETLSRIFDPFFTTKFTGRGLGLAAVLGIVRSHRGGLRVSSRADAGTVFEILLPVSKVSSVVYENGVTRTDLTQSLKSRTILVIDDEQPVREAIRDILELEGVNVLTAKNGRLGIDLYAQQKDEIDLVVLDLSMPELSGSETFTQLCKIDSGVRVLLSSGYSEEDALSRLADSKNLVGFMQKPFEWDTLVDAVSKRLAD